MKIIKVSTYSGDFYFEFMTLNEFVELLQEIPDAIDEIEIIEVKSRKKAIQTWNGREFPEVPKNA